MAKIVVKLPKNIIGIQVGEAIMPANALLQPEPIAAPQTEKTVEMVEMDARLTADYQQGYEEGFKAGELENQRLFQALLKQLALRPQQQWQNVLKELEPEIIGLIIKVVEQFLQIKTETEMEGMKTAAAGRYDIEKIVRKALDELQTVPGLYVVEIQGHPDDMAVLEKNNSYKNLRLIGDSQMAKSNCVIKTNLGRAVVSLQERIKQLAEIWREASKC